MEKTMAWYHGVGLLKRVQLLKFPVPDHAAVNGDLIYFGAVLSSCDIL